MQSLAWRVKHYSVFVCYFFSPRIIFIGDLTFKIIARATNWKAYSVKLYVLHRQGNVKINIYFHSFWWTAVVAGVCFYTVKLLTYLVALIILQRFCIGVATKQFKLLWIYLFVYVFLIMLIYFLCSLFLSLSLCVCVCVCVFYLVSITQIDSQVVLISNIGDFYVSYYHQRSVKSTTKTHLLWHVGALDREKPNSMHQV